jgi:hypothetical protein
MEFLTQLLLTRLFLSKIGHIESTHTLKSLLLLKNSGLVLHFKVDSTSENVTILWMWARVNMCVYHYESLSIIILMFEWMSK